MPLQSPSKYEPCFASRQVLSKSSPRTPTGAGACPHVRFTSVKNKIPSTNVFICPPHQESDSHPETQSNYEGYLKVLDATAFSCAALSASVRGLCAWQCVSLLGFILHRHREARQYFSWYATFGNLLAL